MGQRKGEARAPGETACPAEGQPGELGLGYVSRHVTGAWPHTQSIAQKASDRAKGQRSESKRREPREDTPQEVPINWCKPPQALGEEGPGETETMASE